MYLEYNIVNIHHLFNKYEKEKVAYKCDWSSIFKLKCVFEILLYNKVVLKDFEYFVRLCI